MIARVTAGAVPLLMAGGLHRGSRRSSSCSHRQRPAGPRGCAAGWRRLVGRLLGGGSSGPAARPWPPVRARGTAAAARQLTTAQSDQDMISFTRCMREHGVQMPDPVHRAGHAGLSIDMPSRSPANNAAYAACMHFIQADHHGEGGGRGGPGGAAAGRADPVRAVHARATTSTCWTRRRRRAQPGHVPGITSDFGRYSPQFRAADAACRHFLPAGVTTTGPAREAAEPRAGGRAGGRGRWPARSPPSRSRAARRPRPPPAPPRLATATVARTTWRRRR